MAFQVFHLALGIKGFEFFTNKKEKDFFIGNQFPDIRMVSKLKRLDTHFLEYDDFLIKNKKIKFLDSDSSFITGLKFHILVDLVQKKYYEENNFLFKKYGGMDKIRTSLIFLEDILMYKKINNKQKYILFFDEILKEEKEFNELLNIEEIKKWHYIIKDYFSNNINKNNIKKFRKNYLNYDYNELKEQFKLLDILKKDRKIVDFINNFYDNFNTIIKPFITIKNI